MDDHMILVVSILYSRMLNSLSLESSLQPLTLQKQPIEQDEEW